MDHFTSEKGLNPNGYPVLWDGVPIRWERSPLQNEIRYRENINTVYKFPVKSSLSNNKVLKNSWNSEDEAETFPLPLKKNVNIPCLPDGEEITYVISPNLSSPSSPLKKFIIKSFGVILYHKTEGVYLSSGLRYLIHLRRDSYGYIDFLRGNWKTDEDVVDLFKRMTPDEIQRINQTLDFDLLWDDLWFDKTSFIYKKNKLRAKAKYVAISSKLNELVERIDLSPRSLEKNKWGFPKGKKEPSESSMGCALREFSEETRINKKHLSLTYDITTKQHQTVYEEYTGSDGKRYSTLYYVAETYSTYIPPKLVQNNLRDPTISDEASDLRWVTLDEARELITEDRVSLLESVEASILSGMITTTKPWFPPSTPDYDSLENFLVDHPRRPSFNRGFSSPFLLNERSDNLENTSRTSQTSQKELESFSSRKFIKIFDFQSQKESKGRLHKWEMFTSRVSLLKEENKTRRS